MINKSAGLIILTKIIFHIIFELTRKDGNMTRSLGGADGGGSFLLSIPNHENKELNWIITILNYGYYLSFVVIFLEGLWKLREQCK